MITAVYSDVGSVRKVNEDYYYVSEFNNENGYIIVADGMGGHKGGQVASRTAIDATKATLKSYNLASVNKSEIEKILVECINNANREVFNKALSDDLLSGMGTTLVVCVIIEDTAYIANVGDSRLYVIRKDKIAQVTKDHSIVQELIDRGEITKKQAESHPNKNVITRAVGSDATVKADMYFYKLKKDDYIVMCTDGLSNMVDDSVILKTLVDNDVLQDAVDKLGNLANENGGYDNITLAAVKY